MPDLLTVRINPEMRVKLDRGPAPARLRDGAPTRFTVRVENEARTTALLQLTSPHADDGSGRRDRWLTLSPAGRLTGARTQTVTLTLTGRGVGRREARLLADVGQGTQDLGFRAEVAVLFTLERG